MTLQTPPQRKPDWPALIRNYRLSRSLSQEEFGKLYGVSRVAVLYWETGRNQAPYQVTWDVLRFTPEEDHE